MVKDGKFGGKMSVQEMAWGAESFIEKHGGDDKADKIPLAKAGIAQFLSPILMIIFISFSCVLTKGTSLQAFSGGEPDSFLS